jgi:curved DNA-binding protein CbpA
MTLYALLDVPEDASDAEIKRAYRDAAKKYHPDLNPDAEPGRFARVSEAHEVLSDGSKRAAYDAALRAERDAASTSTLPTTSTTVFAGSRRTPTTSVRVERTEREAPNKSITARATCGAASVWRAREPTTPPPPPRGGDAKRRLR